MKRKAFIVSQTHWDRAWYLPFEQFRIRLVKMIDDLLDLLIREPRYISFTLDGQAIILEDYLEIHPEKKDLIRALIKQGRIMTGPFYVLPDYFKISGESIVRNLLIGKKISEEMGKRMDIGYMPDSFGHVPQLPQILNGFGIDNYIFSRGMVKLRNKHNEFLWQGPDGKSEVIGIWQSDGYANACNLGYPFVCGMREDFLFSMELAIKKLEGAISRLSETSIVPYLLLNNGIDQTEAQPEAPDILDKFNSTHKDISIIHSTYEEYIKSIREYKNKFQKYTGELRSQYYSWLLYGTMSTRMYISQANHKTEMLLEKWCEPTSLLASIYTGKKYEFELIEHAWKELIKNHPHDDICGCSIDDVHKDMLARFRHSQEISDYLTEENLEYISRRIKFDADSSKSDTYPLVIFNGLPFESSEIQTVKVRLPIGNWQNFSLFDYNGKEIPIQVRHIERQYKWFRHQGRDFDFVEFAFSDVLPPLGYKSYKIIPSLSDSEIERTIDSPLKLSDVSAENKFIKLKINGNGSLTLLHKASGVTYDNLHIFEDVEDAGDEYDYSPGKVSQTLTTRKIKASVSLKERESLLATFKIEIPWKLPISLTADRKNRSKTLKSFPITSYVTIYKDSPRLDIVTEIDNNIMDHRLRVRFPTGLETSYWHTHDRFMTVKRPICNETESAGEKYPPCKTAPQQYFSDISGFVRFGDRTYHKRTGLAILNKGLTEVEAYQKDSSISITLLRCVGYLSREDLLTRQGRAGDLLPTPSAQCLGEHKFEYAIYPHIGDFFIGKVTYQAQLYITGVKAHSPIPPFHTPEISKESSLFELSDNRLVVSAIKKAEVGKGIIIRLYNPSSESINAKLSFAGEIKSADFCRMDEKPLKSSSLKILKNELRFKIAKYQILTFRVNLRNKYHFFK